VEIKVSVHFGTKILILRKREWRQKTEDRRQKKEEVLAESRREKRRVTQRKTRNYERGTMNQQPATLFR